MKGLNDALYGMFSITYPSREIEKIKCLNEMKELMISTVKNTYEKRETEIGSDMMRYIEKMVLLQVVDTQWKDHLLGMDHLKEGIGLRGYGQRDPLTEYKKEAFDVFAEMTDRLSVEVLTRLFKIQVKKEGEIKEIPKKQQLHYNKAGSSEGQQPVHKGRKVGRNDPCPCGSGKKYKKCCGVNA